MTGDGVRPPDGHAWRQAHAYRDPASRSARRRSSSSRSGRSPSPRRFAAGDALHRPCARRYPDVRDPKLNSHSKLNGITARIQATAAGADEALMLDLVASSPPATDALLHRPPRRGLDVDRQLTPQRHHPRQRAQVTRASSRARRTQPDRGLQPDEAFVTGTLRRPGAGARDRRAHDRRRGRRAAGADGCAAAGQPRSRRARRRGPRTMTDPMSRRAERRAAPEPAPYHRGGSSGVLAGRGGPSGRGAAHATSARR